jgi:cation transport ATPase
MDLATRVDGPMLDSGPRSRVYRRGWLGVAHRAPNMYTLIGLGVMVAFTYRLATPLSIMVASGLSSVSVIANALRLKSAVD